jgi:hypothetical protein
MEPVSRCDTKMAVWRVLCQGTQRSTVYVVVSGEQHGPGAPLAGQCQECDFLGCDGKSWIRCRVYAGAGSTSRDESSARSISSMGIGGEGTRHELHRAVEANL